MRRWTYLVCLIAPLSIAGTIEASVWNVSSLENSGGLSFLVAAFAVTWVSLFGYMFYLSWKGRGVQQEIRTMTQRVEKTIQSHVESEHPIAGH